MYQDAREGWGWDEYKAYTCCLEDDFVEEEYSDYEQCEQPSWHKFIEYGDSYGSSDDSENEELRLDE